MFFGSFLFWFLKLTGFVSWCVLGGILLGRPFVFFVFCFSLALAS